MKKRIILLAVIALLITAAVICGCFFMREYTEAQEEIAEYTSIQSDYTTTTQVKVPVLTDNTNEEGVSPEIEEPPELLLPYVDVDFQALLQANADTVGWIAIPDTVISYPIVQTSNNSKYLGISFEGRNSKAGTLFADYRNDVVVLDANTIIYGHNMGARRNDMFNTLLLYKDYDYLMEHRYIQFDTIYQQHGFWEIFAVIELDTRNTSFIYQEIQFQDNTLFFEWITKAIDLSIHDTDMNISRLDRILTLSTCDRSRYGQHGRLIILAVRMQSDFTHSYS